LKTLLSTKILTAIQKEPLIKAGVSVLEYDAIKIAFIDFKVPENLKNAIFTSQNAVRAFLEKFPVEKRPGLHCFCVGQKTKLLLEENDLKVMKMDKTASKLVNYITKYHKSDTFSFICGSHRRDEIPTNLKKTKIKFFEIKTYNTTLNPVHFNQQWNGILFFSPSGVQSFVQGNCGLTANKMISPLSGMTSAFCIGDTTASEAKKHTNNVMVAKKTTVESVIEKAIEMFEEKFTK
jgi:uroporphyrinogen-III synthase